MRCCSSYMHGELQPFHHSWYMDNTTADTQKRGEETYKYAEGYTILHIVDIFIGFTILIRNFLMNSACNFLFRVVLFLFSTSQKQEYGKYNENNTKNVVELMFRNMLGGQYS